jgi:hypothetical protein
VIDFRYCQESYNSFEGCPCELQLVMVCTYYINYELSNRVITAYIYSTVQYSTWLGSFQIFLSVIVYLVHRGHEKNLNVIMCVN